jgi:hypothetical protein
MRPNVRYIPKDSIERRFDHLNAVVYLSNSSRISAIAYSGKRSNPDWHFSFRSDEDRQKKIASWLSNIQHHIEYKAKQKEQRKEDPNSWAKGAANLKGDLSKAFPGIRFAVRSETFANGTAIRVSWDNGPTTAEVDQIANQYQHGSFDGMTDCYNYSKGDYSKGSAKYVTTSRHIPDSQYQAMVRDLCALNGVEYYENGYYNIRIGDDLATTIIHRIMVKHSVAAGKTITGLVKTGCTCGMIEEFYKPIIA